MSPDRSVECGGADKTKAMNSACPTCPCLFVVIKEKNSSLSFGSYIRKARLDLGIGQRELAKKIKIAASYLNDIEKEKRSAPKLNVIKKLSEILNLNLNNLNKTLRPLRMILLF